VGHSAIHRQVLYSVPPHRICAGGGTFPILMKTRCAQAAATLPSCTPAPPRPPPATPPLAATSCACRARSPRCWGELRGPSCRRTIWLAGCGRGADNPPVAAARAAAREGARGPRGGGARAAGRHGPRDGRAGGAAVAGGGRAGQNSARHVTEMGCRVKVGMPFNSTNEGSKCLAMTW